MRCTISCPPTFGKGSSGLRSSLVVSKVHGDTRRSLMAKGCTRATKKAESNPRSDFYSNAVNFLTVLTQALARAFRTGFSELPGGAGGFIGFGFLASVEQGLQTHRSQTQSQPLARPPDMGTGKCSHRTGRGELSELCSGDSIISVPDSTHGIIKKAWSCHHACAWCHLSTCLVCTHSVLQCLQGSQMLLVNP